MKDTLKEKTRKCQAWEKVVINIQQLIFITLTY